MTKRNVIIGVVVICAVVGVLIGIAWAYGMFNSIGTFLVRSGNMTSKTVTSITPTPTSTLGTNLAKAMLSGQSLKNVTDSSLKGQLKNANTIKKETEMNQGQRQAEQGVRGKFTSNPTMIDEKLIGVELQKIAGIWRSLGAYMILNAGGTYEIYVGIGDAVTERGTWTTDGSKIYFTNTAGQSSNTQFELSTTSAIAAPYNQWFGFNYRIGNISTIGFGACGRYYSTQEAESFAAWNQSLQCGTAYGYDYGRMSQDPVCRHTIPPYMGYQTYPSCDIYFDPFAWQ